MIVWYEGRGLNNFEFVIHYAHVIMPATSNASFCILVYISWTDLLLYNDTISNSFNMKGFTKNIICNTKGENHANNGSKVISALHLPM